MREKFQKSREYKCVESLRGGRLSRGRIFLKNRLSEILRGRQSESGHYSMRRQKKLLLRMAAGETP